MQTSLSGWDYATFFRWLGDHGALHLMQINGAACHYDEPELITTWDFWEHGWLGGMRDGISKCFEQSANCTIKRNLGHSLNGINSVCK